MAWPRSAMAYLAAFWLRPTDQGANSFLTALNLRCSTLSRRHSPWSNPALKSARAEL